MGCRREEQGPRRRAWLARGCIALAMLLLAATPDSYGDNLAAARRLLRITDAAGEFEQATRLQTRHILRTYSSIVAMSTKRELPGSVKQEIARCYEETFAWQRFETGIAAIFAENLSREELRLLIDFFNDKSVPPPMIDQFKAVVGRAEAIEQLAINYIFSQTEGCDAHNVDLILEFLTNHGS